MLHRPKNIWWLKCRGVVVSWYRMVGSLIPQKNTAALLSHRDAWTGRAAGRLSVFFSLLKDRSLGGPI